MKKVELINGKVYNPEGIEINAVLHCNMSCSSCAHLSPLFKKREIDSSSMKKDLELLAKSYHASYAKIMGGEPLLNPNLIDLIKDVKETGIADDILLTTNSTMLHRANDELWQVIDKIEISLYPSRLPSKERLELFKSKAAENNVEMLINYYENFRVSYSEKPNRNPDLVQKVYNTCKMAHFWHSHTILDGWFYRCPQSVFIPLQGVNGGWDNRVDGIQVSDAVGFADSLYKFLTRPNSLKACENCLGSVGKLRPHIQLSKKEWRPTEDFKDLISTDYLEVCQKDIASDDGCLSSSEFYLNDKR